MNSSRMPGGQGTYHFRTCWRIGGRIERAYEILGCPLDFPKWWNLRNFKACRVQPGDAGGIGQVTAFEMKGWLPYTLRWQVKALEASPPFRLAGISEGDFRGHGIWSLKQEGSEVLVTFEWNVEVRKPFLRYFGFLLKPLFISNHHWVMARAKAGLEKLMA